jgi:transposase-like protein
MVEVMGLEDLKMAATTKGGRTRRFFTRQQQLAIVREALELGVSNTARKHDISIPLLFVWKKKFEGEAKKSKGLVSDNAVNYMQQGGSKPQQSTPDEETMSREELIAENRRLKNTIVRLVTRDCKI